MPGSSTCGSDEGQAGSDFLADRGRQSRRHANSVNVLAATSIQESQEASIITTEYDGDMQHDRDMQFSEIFYISTSCDGK